tara:strand:+ start:1351 stop:2697 length:1347 start_codon:yes stop_codon:yes gene_type:complete
VDIVFTEEGLEAATAASNDHIEGRGNEYVADWSPSVDPGTRTYDAVYRSNQPNTRTLRGNRDSGIYLILDRDTNRAYVGLTNNFGDRFFNGKPTHPRGCQQNCRCHGHITVTLQTCTSHNIINTDSDSGYSVHILEVIPHRGDRISQAEIEWYYILREHGYEMVNAVWALGKKKYVGRPIISFDISNRRHHYFDTISEASIICFGDRYSGNPGPISAVLGPGSTFHSQASGFTHRYATVDEAREYTEGIDFENMINSFDSNIVWTRGAGPEVDLANSCKGCSDPSKKHNSRLFRLHWRSGPLDAVSVEHLRWTGQGAYGKSDWPKKKGVSILRSRANPDFKPRFQVRWKSPEKPKSPHQTNKPKWTRRKLLDATIWRENNILDNNLEAWNTNKYGSNAKWINFRQPWRFIIKNYFTDWEDEETGLLRVLIFYGGILSLLTAAVLQLFG